MRYLINKSIPYTINTNCSTYSILIALELCSKSSLTDDSNESDDIPTGHSYHENETNLTFKGENSCYLVRLGHVFKQSSFNNLDILNEHGEYAALLLLYFMTIHMAFNDSKSTQKNK